MIYLANQKKRLNYWYQNYKYQTCKPVQYILVVVKKLFQIYLLTTHKLTIYKTLLKHVFDFYSNVLMHIHSSFTAYLKQVYIITYNIN